MDARLSAASVGLNSGQQIGLRSTVTALRSGRSTWRLTGPAGTGKTYLTQRIASVLEQEGTEVIGMAPTGRAALQLARSIPRTTTIHSGIFARVQEDLEGKPLFREQDLRFPIEHGVAIIDEASMIGERLYRWIDKAAPPGVRILFQGDYEQLPPVDDAPGVDLEHAEVKLTEVMRQAQDNPILSLATAIRTGGQNQGRPDDRLRLHGRSELDGPVRWLAEHRSRDLYGDSTVTTWANLTRKRINFELRALLGRTAPLQPGDRLVVRKTNHHLGLLNGEVLVVERVEPIRVFAEDFLRVSGRFVQGGSSVSLTVMVRAFGADQQTAVQLRRMLLERILQLVSPGERGLVRQGKLPERYAAEEQLIRGCTLVDYGEALTVHALQGSQMKHLGFALDGAMGKLRNRDPELYRKLCYTAVTRAVETLDTWEVP